MLDSFLHSRLLSVTSRELSEFRHVVVSLFKLFLLSRPEVLPAVLLKLQVFWDVTRHVSFSDCFPKSQRYIPQDVLVICFSLLLFLSLLLYFLILWQHGLGRLQNENRSVRLNPTLQTEA
jgi:hypothetical protein